MGESDRKDPFAFMGTARGTDRADEAPEAMWKPVAEFRFVISGDQAFIDACAALLDHLRHFSDDGHVRGAIPYIARDYGFRCDSHATFWTLAFGNPPVRAHLVGARSSRRVPSGALDEFTLFVQTDGVELA